MSKILDANDPCPARDGYAMPAEWARHVRTWMCWPCRTEAWGGPDGLLRAKQAFARVARAVSTFEPVTVAVRPDEGAEVELACAGKVDVFEVPLDDSWGNKYHPYTDDKAFAGRVLAALGMRAYHAPLVCEGGAIHVDGEGTLITTEQCLLNPNR